MKRDPVDVCPLLHYYRITGDPEVISPTVNHISHAISLKYVEPGLVPSPQFLRCIPHYFEKVTQIMKRTLISEESVNEETSCDLRSVLAAGTEMQESELRECCEPEVGNRFSIETKARAVPNKILLR